MLKLLQSLYVLVIFITLLPGLSRGSILLSYNIKYKQINLE